MNRLSSVLELVYRHQLSRSTLVPRRLLHASITAPQTARKLPKSLRSSKPSTSSPPNPPPRSSAPLPSAAPAKAPPLTPFPNLPASSSTTPHRVAANTPSWPWRPVPSSTPCIIEEERVIYARPFEGPLGSRVRMLWFLVPFYGIVIGFYLTTPSLPKQKPAAAEGEETVAEVPEKETPGSVLWGYATPLAIIAVTLTGAVALLSPSRFVTRLSLVRQRPSAGGDKASEKLFVRMKHGGHLMMTGELAKARILPLDQVQVRQIAQRSPYLSLKVTAPRQSRFSLDAWPYRLDFRDTPVLKHTDEEVVLSLQRVEQVFGRL